MRIAKWGNSLAVRLPAKLIESLGVREGDELEVIATRPGAIEVEAKRRLTASQLSERLAPLRRPLPAGYKFDRDEANER